MNVSFTREEKTRVIELARELGVSATALYRELSTELPAARTRSIRAEVETANIYVAKREYREISREVTDRCKTALTAARNRKEYRLAARIVSALSDRGLMVSSGMGRKVAISAVTDRRGTVEAVGTVEVIRAGVFKLRLTDCNSVELTEQQLLETLLNVLPERIDTTPARYVDKLRIKKARGVSDSTGERATPGAVMGDERDSIAGRPGVESRQGQREVSAAHKREMTRQRVARHRAKQRAARIEVEGREHALKRSDVPAVGTAAIAAPKPALSTDDAPRYVVPRPTGKTIDEMKREADKVRAERDAAKLAAVTAVPVPADDEPLTLF